MEVDNASPPKTADSSESGPSSPKNNVQNGQPNSAPKLPPCDQCRRRKVKCQQNGEGSCERCIQSVLTCTRAIQRKKRGPKKGSGSVIAKLRGESDQIRAQEPGLPPFNLQSLDGQLPDLRQRSYTNDSLEASPLNSPLSSQFSDYGIPSEPIVMPRSVPLGFGDEISNLSNGGFVHGGRQFPSAWRMPDDQPLLQYPSPTTPNDYLSVHDLARQILQDAGPIVEAQPIQDTSLGVSITRPRSIDAVLTATRVPTNSEPASNASSPPPLHGPKYLYRSNSGQEQAEPRLTALASEIGISATLISQCVKQWFRHLYPIQPVLHEPTFMQMLNQQEELSTQEKILVLSLCAVTVTHAAPVSDLTPQNKQDLGRMLLRQCLHLRHTYEWIETANLTTIISSFFMCVTYFEIKQVRSHHFFLREAVGFALEMHVDAEQTEVDSIESICRKRLMALLFITERGFAILRHKRATFIQPPSIPTDHFGPQDELVLAGFKALCDLFAVLDENFIQFWYADEDDVEASPYDNIVAIQYNLNSLSFADSKMTDIQKADVLITHQWLRFTFWQASMRQGLTSVTPQYNVLAYTYPIEIAKDLVQVMRGLSFDAILVHGLGIFEKVFHITYSFMDTLSLAKIDWSTSEDLHYLLDCLRKSPNSYSTYVKVLENKVNLEQSATQSPASQVS